MSRLHNSTSTHVDESRCARELLSDPAAVAAFLQRLMRPGDVHEIRIPHPRRGGPRRLYRAQAGYFDRAEAAGLAVRGIGGGDAAGVYVTLNPVAPALLARSDNVLRDADSTAGDEDIARRTNLLIDCDPARHPADVSATDEEMALAVERRDLVIAYLRDLGWPEPVAVAMSGNGGSAIYRVELAKDDDATALVKRVLAALDHLFSDERVIVDAANFNASRLTKLVGTVAAKGDDFEGRPGVPARRWRLSAATYPAGAGVVTREQLAAVAALAPVEGQNQQPLGVGGGRGSAQRAWTIEQLLELNNLVARPKRMAYATVWQLERCPTSSEHADGAILFEMQNGAVGYRCLHNSCSGWNWQRLREEGLIAIPGEERRNGQRAYSQNSHNSQNSNSANCAKDSETFAWAKPIALRAVKVPPFPTACLPKWLRQMVEAVAIALQVPEDLPAMMCLSTEAACVAGKCVVQAKRGHVEPLNIYSLTILDSGNRKSAAVSEATRPVEDWTRAKAKELADDIAAAHSQKKIMEAALDRLQKTAAKTGLESDIDAAKRAAVDLAKFVVPSVPRIIADDVTPEIIPALLQDNGGSIAILSAEGGLFDTLSGRYSKGQPNIENVLKAHAGDPIRVDRVTRGPEFVEHPALSLGISGQTGVLRGLGKPSFRERGLIARILITVPESKVGYRDTEPDPVPDAVRDAYHRGIKDLLDRKWLTDTDKAQGREVYTLTLSADARRRLTQFERDLEPRLGPEGDLSHIKDWAAKLVGAVVRIAGLLHLAGEFAGYHEINGPEMGNAIEIGEYLIQHALAAFAEIGADESTDDAIYPLSWMQRHLRDKPAPRLFTKRDAFEATKSRFKQAASLDGPLGVLCDHGYIREISPEQPPKVGRPPSPVYELNPDCVEKPSHNSQNSSSANSAKGGAL